AEHQRCVTECLRAARQKQVRTSIANIAIRRVNRLHAGAAIDLNGKGRHRFAHAEPQGCNASRIHLVGNDVDAAEDNLIEGVGRERLAQQQWAATLHRQIDRRERPRFTACLDERRPAAIDDIDRSRGYCAAGLRAFACDDTSPFLAAPRDVNSCGEKSLTAMAADTASAADLSSAASPAVMIFCASALSASRTRAACMRSRIGWTATVLANARWTRATPSSASALGL